MRLLKLLLLSASANALSWIILIPLWQYPDEQAHFAQVQFIAERGGIPRDNKDFDTSYEISFSEKLLNTERDEMGNNKFTYNPNFKLNYSDDVFGPGERKLISLSKSQRVNLVKNEATLNPPLYYNLASVVYKAFYSGSLITRVFAIRIMSAMFFIFLIFVSYKIGEIVSHKNPIFSITLAALIAFMPMLVFSSTGVLPDTLTNLLFSIFLMLCLMLINPGNLVIKLLITLVVIVLGALTRQHFLISIFILPVAILIRFIMHKKERKKVLLLTITFLVSIYLLSYFIEPLNFIRRFDYPESSQKIKNNPLANLSYLEHLKWSSERLYKEMLPWFWGVYKWLSLTLPQTVYRIIKIVIFISLIGISIKLYEILKTKSAKLKKEFLFLLFSAFFYSLALITFDYQFRKNNGYAFGLQGRYFFPVITALMAIFIQGYLQIFNFSKKLSKYSLFFLVLLMAIFNNFSLYFVTSSYYDLSSLSIFISQASQFKPIAIKGEIILLLLGVALLFQAVFLAGFYAYLTKNKQKIYN